MPAALFTPAVIWRAFFVGVLLGAAGLRAAPTTGATQPPTDYVQFSRPDQEEGRRVLARFRQAGIAGQYYFEFDLRVMPRRGEERVFHGRLWGGRNAEGAVMRVAMADATGRGERDDRCQLHP